MITVVGVPQLLTRFAGKVVASELALEQGIDQLGEDVEIEAKRLVPVLTGNLQDSIEYLPGQGRVIVSEPYAAAVEYGGPHNPPEPYLRPAADTVNDQMALNTMKVVFDRA